MFLFVLFTRELSNVQPRELSWHEQNAKRQTNKSNIKQHACIEEVEDHIQRTVPVIALVPVQNKVEVRLRCVGR